MNFKSIKNVRDIVVHAVKMVIIASERFTMGADPKWCGGIMKHYMNDLIKSDLTDTERFFAYDRMKGRPLFDFQQLLGDKYLWKQDESLASLLLGGDQTTEDWTGVDKTKKEMAILKLKGVGNA